MSLGGSATRAWRSVQNTRPAVVAVAPVGWPAGADLNRGRTIRVLPIGRACPDAAARAYVVK